MGLEYKPNVSCPGQPSLVGDQKISAQLKIGTNIDLPVLQFHFDENYYMLGSEDQRAGRYSKSEEFKWGLCQATDKNGDDGEVSKRWTCLATLSRYTRATLPGN